jgi:hypothetical protein
MYRSHLSKTQKAVLEDLLQNGISEQEAMQKHNVSIYRYRKWLANGLFTHELNLRIESAMRQKMIAMARSLPQAVAKLVDLTSSQKDETARKACLDIMATQISNVPNQTDQTAATEDEPLTISDEKAARMLDILAEKEKTPCRVDSLPVHADANSL